MIGRTSGEATPARSTRASMMPRLKVAVLSPLIVASSVAAALRKIFVGAVIGLLPV